jgi:hypothetical protein
MIVTMYIVQSTDLLRILLKIELRNFFKFLNEIVSAEALKII